MVKPLRARWLTFLMRASESRDRLPYIYAAMFVLVAWVSALFAIYKAHDSEVTHLKNAFIEQKNEDARKKIGDIQNFFKSIYESIRTIAMLPSVRKIDRYGKSLDADAKETIQQIYNNAYLNAAISEFYILPKNFDPDRFDPRTGELERPVMTFDEFISGIHKGNKTNQKDKPLAANKIGKVVLKEEEIYEYREMVKQLKELETIPKNLANIDRLNFPALVSNKVITCDNSHFSIADLQNKNDEPRKGYVYTVPTFDHLGAMNGGVSAVFLHSVISNALGESSMALVNRE
ncbi:MAG TPA: hypothetical protein PLU50_10765, partial [Pseudobdellovibrionaceae bacterium]|nr:hypothetical protein [Pseudobdellovibrionaceae bacterium]